jgi:hypothetical protein
MIWNKDYNINTMLYDNCSRLLYNNGGINYYFVFNGKKRPIKELSIQQLRGMLNRDDIIEFVREARSIVNTGQGGAA